jgi:hypothetical protein
VRSSDVFLKKPENKVFKLNMCFLSWGKWNNQELLYNV